MLHLPITSSIWESPFTYKNVFEPLALNPTPRFYEGSSSKTINLTFMKKIIRSMVVLSINSLLLFIDCEKGLEAGIKIGEHAKQRAKTDGAE